MKIYKLTHNSNGFKTIDLKESKLLKAIINDFYNDGKPYAQTFGNYNWIEPNESVCDFPFISGAIPVISENIYKELETYIKKSNIELLSINVEGKNYFVFHFLNSFNNILNKRCSKIEYFKNGTIKNIKEYVFLPNVKDVSPIFTIEELNTYTFINEEVANILKKHSNCGIELEECKIRIS